MEALSFQAISSCLTDLLNTDGRRYCLEALRFLTISSCLTDLLWFYQHFTLQCLAVSKQTFDCNIEQHYYSLTINDRQITI